MIRFFKTLQPATLSLIPVIIFAFWIRVIFKANPIEDENTLPLWDIVHSFLQVFPSWINFIVLFALITYEAIYLNLMLNKHEVLYKNTFLPSLIFAILISSTPLLMQFHPVHLVNLLLLIILNRLFSLFKSSSPVSALFDSAFLSGIIALIYFPGFIIFPFLLITLIILRPFNIKEWLIMLIGICLPFFFISVFYFWKQSLGGFWKMYIEMFRKIRPELIIESGVELTILVIYILLILIYALIKLRLNFRKNIIRTRNNQQIIMVLMIMGIGWLMLAEKIKVIHFAFLLIPISIFSSYLFISAKKRVLIFEYVLWGLIAIILWNHLA
jgi:hypothetical protein